MDGPAFITALINDLQEVRRYLGDELSAELDRLLEQLRQAGDNRDELEERTLDIVELVEPELPPGHPVREAISSAMRFDSSRPREWEAALSRIRTVDLAAPYPSPEHLLTEIHTSLLAAPAYRPDDVLDGYDPHLVRLSAGDGTTRVPAFQFDADGLALPVVLLINRLLDVDDDPWGVAGWWLYGNAWLGTAPAELLGTDRDDDLVAAAQAELEGF